jgi:hypothetical protein
LDYYLLGGDLGPSTSTFASRSIVDRFIDKATTIVDPEYLVFDSRSEYPPSLVATVQQVLDRLGEYLRGQPADPGPSSP